MQRAQEEVQNERIQPIALHFPEFVRTDLFNKVSCNKLPEGTAYVCTEPKYIGKMVVDKSKKYRYELGQWDQPGSYVEV